MKTLLAILLAAAPLAAGPENTFLLRGATIHTVSGPDIAGGSLLVVDGAIAEVGVKIVAPKGIRIIEGKGLHVYPGMIDSATNIGLSEVGSVRETQDTAEIGDFNPQLRALIAVNPASDHIAVTRANGLTSVITYPTGGVISGQAAMIHLDGWTWEEMEVRRAAALHLRFPALQTVSRFGGFGGEDPPGGRTSFTEIKRRYDEQIARLREFFEQARRYQKAKAAAGRDFKSDLKLESMLPVLEGKLPVMVTAMRERTIREALQFAEKEKIRIILAQVREPGKMAAELKAKNIPVILSETLDMPLEEDSPYDGAFTLPAELHKAGVKFAFGTFNTSASRNLPYQAATAVAFGLPYAEGLKAVTLNAAQIWGVDDKLGSIDKGKWADLMVTDDDPLETRTQVKHLFIRGREVSLDNKHRSLYQKYLNRP